MKHKARITASVLCAAALLLTGCSRSKTVAQDKIKLPGLWWIGSENFTADGKVTRSYDSGIRIGGCDIPTEEVYVFSNPDGDKLFYDLQGRFRAYQYHITSAYDCSCDPIMNMPDPSLSKEAVQKRIAQTVPVGTIPVSETPDENGDAPVQMSDREMVRLSLDGWWAPSPKDNYSVQVSYALNTLVPDYREYTELNEVIEHYDETSGEYTPCRVTARRRYGNAAADKAGIVINIAGTVEDVTVEYADISEKEADAVSEQFTEKARAFAEEYFPKQYGESYQGISGIRCDCRKIGGKVYGFCTVTCTVGESGQSAAEISEEFIVSES